MPSTPTLEAYPPNTARPHLPAAVSAPATGGTSMASTTRVRRLAGTAGLATLVTAGLIAGVTHADAATSSLAAASIYVSPSGTAAGAGTESDPTNLATAITKVAAGGSIYLRGGTYKLSTTQTVAVGNNGTSGALKTLSA